MEQIKFFLKLLNVNKYFLCYKLNLEKLEKLFSLNLTY